jgi:predicted amidohydrolase
MFESACAAFDAAQTIPGEATTALAELCSATGMSCIVGVLEKEGEVLYNSAVVLGPGGLVGRYRKTHLPVLGVDRFVAPGTEAPNVYEIGCARVGVEICYDLRFPEVTRALALGGAEIVVNPTNWPANAAPLADFIIRSRAAENRVWILAANRVGVEGAATFIGRTQVVDPMGNRVLELDATSSGLLSTNIDPELAAEKDLVFDPGAYEIHLFADRRPELYETLAETCAVRS